jgi:hypothetical protein
MKPKKEISSHYQHPSLVVAAAVIEQQVEYVILVWNSNLVAVIY